MGAKIDYAVCAGDQEELQGPGVPTPPVPATWTYTGICYVRSAVRMSEITDGTSNTLMISEYIMWLSGLLRPLRSRRSFCGLLPRVRCCAATRG